jgi:hypothetical protein
MSWYLWVIVVVGVLFVAYLGVGMFFFFSIPKKERNPLEIITWGFWVLVARLLDRDDY